MSDPIFIGGILLTEENYLSLRKAYRKALAENKHEFTWNGHDWLREFVKHVLHSMETYAIIKPLINQPDD